MNYSSLKLYNQHQRGAALVVSLIILVAMTMLGITSMKSSTTELTMSGNLRESALSFQAAEAGLRTAETIVTTSISPAMFDDSTDSLLSINTADPDYLNDTTWVNTTHIPISLAGINTNPQYIIKYLGKWDQNPNARVEENFGGYGAQITGRIVSNFRITSRGSGQTDNTFRTVQSFYGREYN